MEEKFAEELKELCLRHKIADIQAVFRLLIEDHSVSHQRVYTYKSKENSSNNTESSVLEILSKINI